MRTFGVEEEFLLVDPATGRVATGPTPCCAASARARTTTWSTTSCSRHQVETRTEPRTDLADLREQLVDARRLVGEAARDAGVAAVATGTAPFGVGDVEVSPKDRYRAMVNEFGELSREAGTCGMHVHVGIDSREEGIGIIDRLRPWLPVVLALSVNSPYAEGRDSGYASWRVPGVVPLAHGRRHRAVRRPRDVRRPGRRA